MQLVERHYAPLGIVNLVVPMPSPGVAVGRLPRALPLRGHRRTRDLLPDLEALGHLVPILRSGESVASWSEVLGNGTIRGQETLRMTR